MPECPLLALSGHTELHCTCPLSGGKAENLISAIGLLVQRDEIRNEVFLVADATPVSLPEIIARLRHGMGRPANLISIPPALLSDLFRMWRMSEQWEKLAGNLTVSVAKLNGIGYSPVIATLEGPRRTRGGTRAHLQVRIKRIAGARPAQCQAWQCRQISLRMPLRNISMAPAYFSRRLNGKGPTLRHRPLRGP